MEKKIEVRNLRISFKTNSGTVKAVRDISFTINKGDTLAIVGESGSGKSVTAKAILGILAGNSIVEGGEIIYDGRDLLKLNEEEFNSIRGNKISMIYQDPLSSLDPIMRIGKQMTEATLINAKTNRKHGRRNFDQRVKALEKAMEQAGISASEAASLCGAIKTKFPEASRKRVAYNTAREYMEAAVFSCEQVAVAAKKGDDKLLKEELGYLKERLELSLNPDLLKENDTLTGLKNGLPETSEKLEAYLNGVLEQPQPDFFADCCSKEMEQAVIKAYEHNEEQYKPKMQQVCDGLKAARPTFEAEKLNIGECKKQIASLKKLVAASIDPLRVHQDASAATFGSTMDYSIRRYAKGVTGNVKELKRVEKDTAKYEKELKKKNDVPKVIPAVLVDLELTQHTMMLAIDELLECYEGHISGSLERDAEAEARNMIAYLEEQSEAMVTVVSKKLAYDKAIQIMEDVGISEPRKRFEQYPFEFSGGMRQRIVIAIAVAANPDILICDEPTTALDVTIQSQILELINDLKKKRNLTVIFITHDLGVVANIADQVAVMYAGKLVEYGTADEVFYEPAHPYTWALLSSMPDLDTSDRLESIPGTPPNMIYPPKGDAFADRNKYALAIDFEQQPPQFQISETHWAATWLLHPKAPKVEIPALVTERIARMKALEEEAKLHD